MGFNSKTQTFDTISDLRTRSAIDDCTVNVSGYYAIGDGGGGKFYYDATSSEDDDGGLIIKPTDVVGDGRWKRFTQGRIYNILWWGAKADGVTDNLEIFENAIASVPNIPQPPSQYGYNLKGIFYFPGSPDSYYFSDTYDCYDGITILGDEGMDSFMATILEWPTNTTGIHVHANQDGVTRGSHGFRGANFKVKSVITTNDYTHHGILYNRPGHLANVHAEGFGGAGFAIQSNIEGIADIGYMVNCSGYANGLAGLYTFGVDSNQWVIANINVFGNTRFGIWEKSFLGNTYISPHSNSNTVVPNNPVWAFNNGETYACIQDHTNKEPGVAVDWEDYWVLVDLGVPSATPYHPQWTSNFAYLEGGTYVSEGETNASDWGNNWYAEGGQAPSRFAGFNKGAKGADGAGIVGRAAMMGAENGMNVFFGGLVSKVKKSFNEYPDVEATIDNLGFSLFPVNQSTGQRESGTSLLWDSTLNAYAQIFNNSNSFSAYWMTTAATDKTLFGLTGNVLLGLMAFPRGFYLGIEDSANHYRSFGFSESVPTNGEHAVGDVRLKRITAASDTVIGWRCTVAGTPGTWEALNIGQAQLSGTGFVKATGTTISYDNSTYVPTSRTINGNALSSDVTLSKSDVGLGNADNTSDANKPVSTAQQTALDLKANLASPTFTGTVSGVTATMVGLGNVDNTSDATKNAASATLTNKTISGASNTLSNIPTSAVTGYSGYVLYVQSLTSSPADGQTIYWGSIPRAPNVTAAASKAYIPKAGTIKKVVIYSNAGTAGSAEAWSLYVRHNDTTDYLIQSLSLSTSERSWSNAAMSIVVAEGDFIEIKSVNPTWATNPLTFITGGYVYIE